VYQNKGVSEMPETISCSICGKRIRGKNFADIMDKLRSHRKREHPRAFRESIRRGVETRRKGRR